MCVCAAGETGAYDPTGQAGYREACRTLGVVPASYALRHLQSSELIMTHHGLGPQVGAAVTPANHGPSSHPHRERESSCRHPPIQDDHAFIYSIVNPESSSSNETASLGFI